MRRAARAASPVLAIAVAALGSRVSADCDCDPRPLDVVFCVDSTGSMTGALEGVKRRITRILELLKENAPQVRVGIVTYRDIGDEYLVRGQELTDDFPKVAEYMKGITANGGGDTPEAVEAGLEMTYSQDQMHWGGRSKKVAVLVADAPAHDDKKQLCLDLTTSGRKKGILTFTISVDGMVSGFKEIAAAGGGKNVDIQRSDDIARNILALTLDRDEKEFRGAFAGDAGAPAPAEHAPAIRTTSAPNAGGFVLNQLMYQGAWDPPHAHQRLLRVLHDRAGIECEPERRVVRATDEALQRDPFLYVTGHGDVRLSPDEERALVKFLERGGTILIERCCDGEAFDTSARALAKRLTGSDLVEAGPDHPVYRSGSVVETLDHTRTHGSSDFERRRPAIFMVADRSGHPMVIYSPTDLGCGWSGVDGGKSCALREPDALRWTVNIILYILST